MKEQRGSMNIGGIEMEVVRKRVRHLRVTILPPEGRVRVSAPLSAGLSDVRRFIADHFDWIEKHREKLSERHRRKKLVTGDAAHRMYLGKAYPLRVVEQPGRARVAFSALTGFELRIPAERDAASREKVLEDWYRDRLKELLEPLVEKWRVTLGVDLREWSLRRMKTRWGSCNIAARRVWFSVELAKKAPECLEYLVVHELAHLIERGHGPRFKAVLDRYLPDWKVRRAALSDDGIEID